MYLNGKQLAEICDFMGFTLDLDKAPEDFLETEVCVRMGDIYEGNKVIYTDGIVVYLSDYPEEGAIGLEDEKYVR